MQEMKLIILGYMNFLIYYIESTIESNSYLHVEILKYLIVSSNKIYNFPFKHKKRLNAIFLHGHKYDKTFFQIFIVLAIKMCLDT